MILNLKITATLNVVMLVMLVMLVVSQLLGPEIETHTPLNVEVLNDSSQLHEK